jgi:hypothetical protein
MLAELRALESCTKKGGTGARRINENESQTEPIFLASQRVSVVGNCTLSKQILHCAAYTSDLLGIIEKG